MCVHHQLPPNKYISGLVLRIESKNQKTKYLFPSATCVWDPKKNQHMCVCAKKKKQNQNYLPNDGYQMCVSLNFVCVYLTMFLLKKKKNMFKIVKLILYFLAFKILIIFFLLFCINTFLCIHFIIVISGLLLYLSIKMFKTNFF